MTEPTPIDHSKVLRVQWLKVELHTATAFLNRTRIASDPAVRERNRANARKAYDVILDALAKTTLDAKDAAEIKQGVHRLQRGLQQLGEVF